VSHRSPGRARAAIAHELRRESAGPVGERTSEVLAERKPPAKRGVLGSDRRGAVGVVVHEVDAGSRT